MTHLIEKQTIELRLNKASDAFEMQQKVSAFCHNQLMPALEEVFNRLAPSEKHIRLDELVIDLGNVSEQQLLTPTFLQHIIERIEQTIEANLRDKPEQVVVQHKETNVFKQWLYFLENGRLPWYAHGRPPDFEAEIPKVLALSEAAIVQLQGLLKRESRALQRLIQQHDAAFLALIAGIYTGSVQKDLTVIAAAIRQSVGRNSAEMYWQLVFKRVILLRKKWASADLIVRTLGDLLARLADNAADFDKSELALDETSDAFGNNSNTVDNSGGTDLSRDYREGSFSNGILPDDFPFLAATADFLRKEQPNNAWALRERALAVRPLKSPVRLADNALLIVDKELDKVTNETLDEAMGLAAKSADDFRDSRTEVRDTGATPTEMYIANAGIVLLHPFLSRLFENLELTSGGVFTDKRLKDKALTVLHYLATGEASVLEYNLMLPKLLCDTPFNQPVDGQWILSDEEKDTCDGLLKVAIDYWSALGKTSPEGLREAFLQRKGKLIHRPSGWLLQVERTTIDVLIDRLPWGLGVVKLPWMRDFLTVEW